jgi:hypothetical protein
LTTFHKKKVDAHTENVDAQLCIDGGEEPINKMNEPPRDVECYCYGEENYTEGEHKQITTSVYVAGMTKNH